MIMLTEDDHLNLYFLLTAPEEVLCEWFHTVSHDDHMYAARLMTAYSLILSDREANDQIESELAALDGQYADAVRVLKHF